MLGLTAVCSNCLFLFPAEVKFEELLTQPFISVPQMNIHGKIQEVLAETARVDPGSGRLSEEDFRRALQRRGIIDDVMKDLRFSQVFSPLTDRSHVRNEESCLYSEKTEELYH